MTSDFYFTATSWFPGNIRLKPHSKHSAPPHPDFETFWQSCYISCWHLLYTFSLQLQIVPEPDVLNQSQRSNNSFLNTSQGSLLMADAIKVSGCQLDNFYSKAVSNLRIWVVEMCNMRPLLLLFTILENIFNPVLSNRHPLIKEARRNSSKKGLKNTEKAAPLYYPQLPQV